MTITQAQTEGAGGFALSLLAAPLTIRILRALQDDPKSLFDLRRAAGSPPQTTMRGHLRTLSDSGILDRKLQNSFPGSVEYELLRPGHELLAVAEILEEWLSEGPEDALELGETSAKSVVKAFVDAWSATIIRAFVARPLSLTELSRFITELSYPSLERRLAALRLAGLIERSANSGRGTRYAVTDWMRRIVRPLAAAIRWERRHVPERSAPITRADLASIFMLIAPLIDLPTAQTGECRLAIERRSNGQSEILVGVVLGIEEGHVASCVSRSDGQASACASGSASAWLETLVDRVPEGLELGGDRALARAVLDGLDRAAINQPSPRAT